VKIVLIDPPFEGPDSLGNNVSLAPVVNVVPSMGLAYLAAVLEKAGHAVKILDATLGLSSASVLDETVRFGPQIIGVTATTPNFRSARRLAQEIRRQLPEILLVLGGAHVTCAPEHAMSFGLFNVGVVGEGEETLLELVKTYAARGAAGLESVPGLVFRRDNDLIRTPPRPFIHRLDELPFPARHLQPPLAAYRPTPCTYRRLPLGVMITSRGCPSKCTFCDRSIFGTKYRTRSPENVVAELSEVVRKHGAREIRFYDDAFTLDHRRVYTILDLMAKEKLRPSWTCLTKARGISRDLLAAMKAGGCWQVQFGLESGDPEMLLRMGKGNTVEDNRRAVSWARTLGLTVRGDFVVGTPGETAQSLERTFCHAVKLKLDYAYFHKFVPYPGSELYETLTARGHRFDFDTLGSSVVDNDSIHYVPDGLDAAHYRRWLNAVYKRFYFRFGYVLRRAMAVRSWEEWRGQVRGFQAVAGLKT